MSDCQRFVTQLNEFLDGELSGEFRAWAEAHEAGCPPCGKVSRQTRKMLALYRTLPEPRVKAAALQRILESLGTGSASI